MHASEPHAGETFNLYQVVSGAAQHQTQSTAALRRTITWTVICASTDPAIGQKFAYEVELLRPDDECQRHSQRHACHGERDADVLLGGRNASFALVDVLRFADEARVSIYKLNILGGVKTELLDHLRL